MAVTAMAFAAGAVTADEMAGMTLKIDRQGGVPYGTSGTVSIAASTSVADMWEITGFAGKFMDYPSALKVSIADDGTVTAATQMLGGDYDYSTYETVYMMFVNAADKANSPMQLSTPVKGTYANGVLTLDDWNVVKVNSSFSENKGARFTQDLSTMIAAPNATTSMGLWDVRVNEDWDFLGWNKLDMSDPNKVVYAEQNGSELTLCNINEVNVCADFDINFDAMTVTAKADQLVYRNTSGSEYKLAKIPATLYSEQHDALTDPVVGTIGADLKTITFENLMACRTGMFANTDYTAGSPMHKLVIVLDNPLQKATAIDSNVGSKSVSSVKYVNLAGQVSSQAFDGVNIVLTTYSDGTTSAVKVIK